MVIVRSKTWGWHNDFFDRGKSRDVRNSGKGQKPFVVHVCDVIKANQTGLPPPPPMDVDHGADKGKMRRGESIVVVFTFSRYGTIPLLPYPNLSLNDQSAAYLL